MWFKMFLLWLYGCVCAEKRILADTEINLEQEVITLKATVAALQSKVGSMFVHWGRNTCPATSDLVYTGYTAGKYFNEGGSGADMLCLPHDPTWAHYDDGNFGDYRARIFGAEIDLPYATHFFQYDVHEQDMPCSLCRSKYMATSMFPARTNCYPGWTMEYHGYLMAGTHERVGSYNHICMDGNPEFLQHGASNDNQNILYLVEAQCGSLPCPPYHQGRELACAVCSK